MKVITVDDFYHRYINDVTSDSFKGGVFISDEMLATLKTDYRGEIEWITIKQPVLSSHVAMYFEQNHFLFEPINEKINQLINGGIIDHWIKNATNSRYNLEKQTKRGPKVLTMNHLMIGFQVWLLFLAFACSVLNFFLI